jgi:hypothetical protein
MRWIPYEIQLRLEMHSFLDRADTMIGIVAEAFPRHLGV